jgi:protein-tyrosine-phosphatase
VAESDSLRILVVCTANQCRSPLTAAALARHATAHDVHLEVSSAGIQAVHGLPATSPTIDAARKIGLDLSQHVSTPLDPGVVRSADVVIALERRHVQEIVLADPSSFSRTFTLKELVRRGTVAGPKPASQPVREWLQVLHRGRRPTDLLGASSDDDVTDPTGSNATDHRTTAEEVDALTRVVVALLSGS